MSSIITFYSYKGGVGRSMALANTAVLLARRGKVLVVDWDLEAPGIERYFSYFTIDSRGSGLLNFFVERSLGFQTQYRDYLCTVRDGSGMEFSLLASGKDVDNKYSANLEAFQWQDFFQGGGGDFIEALRNQWRQDFDFVLIDSRTGLSDTGGICTIQLPDIVVAMFTPNQQSLYGARDVMRLAQAARQSLAFDRTQLSVIPLPARFGKSTELQESEEWLDRSAEAMGEFYRDWLPNWSTPRDVLEQLCIPQVDYFGFGEKLAVVEQGTSDPTGMGFVYDRLATLIAGDLRAVETVLKLKKSEIQPTDSPRQDGYEYDVYVSYAHNPTIEEWLRPFMQLLGDYLSELKGKPAKVFFDYREISVGSNWPSALRRTLVRSKLLLAVMTPAYFKSDYCLAEWETFSEREKRWDKDRISSIFPVVLVGDSERFPGWAADRTHFDLTQLFGRGTKTFLQKRPSLEMLDQVSRLATAIDSALREVPPFDPATPVVSPDEALTRTAHEGSNIPAGGAEKIRHALSDGRWEWRSIDALSAKAALTIDQTLDLVRSDPLVELGRSKTGKTIARLKKRRL